MPLKDTNRILRVKLEAKTHMFYDSEVCGAAINKNHLTRHQNSSNCVLASRKDERWQFQTEGRRYYYCTCINGSN